MAIEDWDSATRAPIPGSRTPQSWGPLGQLTLTAGDKPYPVGGVKLGRAAFMISNVGRNPVLIRSTSTVNATPFTLPPYSYIVLATEAEIWLSCTLGGVVDLIEMSFLLTGSGVFPPGQIPFADISGAV